MLPYKAEYNGEIFWLCYQCNKDHDFKEQAEACCKEWDYYDVPEQPYMDVPDPFKGE